MQQPVGDGYDASAELVTLGKLRRACREYDLRLTEEELRMMIDTVA